MEISNRIKELRIRRDLTLEEVGDYVGVSKATVLKWESGQIKNMRRDKLVRLAEILGITPGELIGWTKPEAPVIPDDYMQVTPHERAVITAYRENPGMQPAVNRLLNVPDEVPENER